MFVATFFPLLGSGLINLDECLHMKIKGKIANSARAIGRGDGIRIDIELDTQLDSLFHTTQVWRQNFAKFVLDAIFRLEYLTKGSLYAVILTMIGRDSAQITKGNAVKMLCFLIIKYKV